MDGIWVGEFAEAGYIAPLSDTVGDAVDAWDGWDQINAAVQANGQYKGVRYGLPQGTDGRVIYTNKEIFEAAGLPADWSPATMDDVLDAARQIKANVPDVVPFQLNGGVSMGEATTMQGVLPLLAAAGAPVWDSETGLWTGNTPEMVRCSAPMPPSTATRNSATPSGSYCRTAVTSRSSSSPPASAC